MLGRQSRRRCGIADSEPRGGRRQVSGLDVDQRVEVYLGVLGRLCFSATYSRRWGSCRARRRRDRRSADRITGVFVSQHRDEAVAAAVNLAQPVVGCESHAGAVEGGKVRGIQRADEIVSHESVGGDDLDVRAAARRRSTVEAPGRCRDHRRRARGALVTSPRGCPRRHRQMFPADSVGVAGMPPVATITASGSSA